MTCAARYQQQEPGRACLVLPDATGARVVNLLIVDLPTCRTTGGIDLVWLPYPGPVLTPFSALNWYGFRVFIPRGWSLITQDPTFLTGKFWERGPRELPPSGSWVALLHKYPGPVWAVAPSVLLWARVVGANVRPVTRAMVSFRG